MIRTARPGPQPPKNKTYKSYKTYRSYFLFRRVSSDPRVAFFGKTEKNSESGLTKRKRVVYLCPIAPDDGDVGGCGAEKILKKMDFGFDKAEKYAIFHPYAPEAARLDEAVLKKF